MLLTSHTQSVEEEQHKTQTHTHRIENHETVENQSQTNNES